jgi:hypothetical protein
LKKNAKEIRKHVSSLSTVKNNNKIKIAVETANAVETAKIVVDSCYVQQQFLTPLPSIDFREIRGLPVGCCNIPMQRNFLLNFRNFLF